MDFAKIRPRGGTKAQWETANPVLGKREMGVQWESEIGVGKVVIKFGNGVTAWNNLDTAVEVENDLVNKIISSIVTVSDEYPILNDGDSLSTLVGKIKKYIQDLKDKKLDKSARYDGTDSTSIELVPTANALRGVNAKADKNASDITTLNNNLSNGSVKSYFSPHKNNEADLCKGYNNSDGVFYFNYQGALVPIKKYVFSDGQGNGIFSSDQLVKNSDLPKNFKFLNLKYDTASSYDTEVLQYIESLKKAVFIIYCEHGSASMYMGFIVGDGKYGTVLRFEYNSLYINGCSGDAWAGWTKLG